MNKKATSSGTYILQTLLRLFVIFFLVGMLVYFAGAMEKSGLDAHRIREKIILNRLFYSPHSFVVYNQNVDRINPYIIDKSKFNQDVISNLFRVSSIDGLSGNLILNNLDTDEETEIFINQEGFNRDSYLTKFDQYDQIVKKKYVLIKDDNVINKGVLEINIVFRK